MKTILFLIIIATGIGFYTSVSPQYRVDFEKISTIKTASIINFNKIERLPVIGAVFSRKNISRVESAFDDFFSWLQQSAWVKWCREDPVTSGLLLMVGGLGVCLFGFIVHLVRSDLRFS